MVVSDGEGRAEMHPFLVRIPTVINGTESYYLKATPKTVLPGGSSADADKENPKEDTKEEPKEELKEDPNEEPETSADAENADTPTKSIEDADVPYHKLEMDSSAIPQTGAVRYPIWLLNGFGAVCIIAGLFQLRKAASEETNEEDMLDEEA